jgi:hypothetical protein
MTWKEAIKKSPENTAILRRGDFCYLKYPNGSVFHATAGNWKIKKKCQGSDARIDGNWEPLGLRLGEIPKNF